MEKMETLRILMLSAKVNLDSCKQLEKVKNAIICIDEAILETSRIDPWDPPVVEKKPIELHSDEELLAELKKRMNRPYVAAKA
jgi:hypothetical protein